MNSVWKPLVNQPPFDSSTMLLLTDGSVMCHDGGSAAWWRFTPDIKGSYINGTWTPLAPMHHTRLYYASAVLNDGRVFLHRQVGRKLVMPRVVCYRMVMFSLVR